MTRYPERLAHKTPAWVQGGSTYHIRIRVDSTHAMDLTTPQTGSVLLDSARFYHDRELWACRLFLLMPDHLHALLVFPYDSPMGDIVGAWKGYLTKRHGVCWQKNFFDHRIRDRHELERKATYVRLNPVRKGLCAKEADWPWVVTGEF